jgi:hypothetical protein
VGLFDYFRRRRERESAVPSLEVTPPSTQVRPLAGAGEAEGVAQAPAIDLAQLGQIGAMIAEAARSGNVQIQQGDSVEFGGAQTVDLRGSGLREEIMGIMERHGIDPDPASAQEIDAGQMPEMQMEIIDAIARQGVDLSAYLGGGDASPGIPGGESPGGD